MKAVDEIKDQSQCYNNYNETHKLKVAMCLWADGTMRQWKLPHVHWYIVTLTYCQMVYAYFTIMDSITFAASSHLSVAVSITW